MGPQIITPAGKVLGTRVFPTKWNKAPKTKLKKTLRNPKNKIRPPPLQKSPRPPFTLKEPFFWNSPKKKQSKLKEKTISPGAFSSKFPLKKGPFK